MNLYSRALRHIDMDDVKRRREDKIVKQKIIEEVTKNIAKQIEEELKRLDTIEFSNWRKELNEQMTTAAIGVVNLDATGDVDIVDTNTTFDNIDTSQNLSRSGDTVTLAGSVNNIVGGTHTAYRVARFLIDGTKSSTLKITISKGGGTTSWTDRGESWDDNVSLNINNLDDILGPSYYNGNLGSGTHLIPLPGNYERLYISIEQFAKVASDGSPDTTGSLTVTNASLQRRTPVNVFVGLDSPEASAFIRTEPTTSNLSPAQKEKRLKEMIAASDEYLAKMFGDQFPGTGAVAPKEVAMPQSWQQDVSSRSRSFGKRQSISSVGVSQQMYRSDLKKAGYSDKQIAQKTNVRYIAAKKETERAKAEYDALLAKASKSKTPVDLTKAKQDFEAASAREFDIMMGRQSTNKDSYMDIRVGDQKSSPVSQPQSKPTSKQSANTDTQIAGLPPGINFIDPTPPNKGPSGYKRPGTYDPKQFYKIDPNSGPQFPSPNLPNTGPGLSKSGQDTQIAWNTPVLPTGPSTPVKYDKRMKEIVPSGRGGFPGNYPRGYLPSASKNKKQPMVASYEPQGQVLSEKKLKSPKEILNKIPGYYDGKPAPLGFPETPPPEMKNGMHPDLVDGKKVSDRFNRLDPQSAKAMPLTGNPHIDKKVKAARKKSK